jgi:ubiquinone/menaquinone biosynthesis C-methylase UbiE
VLGIDVAAPLLELARARAADEGLANIEFRSGDATRTGLPDGGFDAVVCVFRVFFAADMTAFLREIWRLVRPGGVVAVTTWGPGLFEPAGVTTVCATLLPGDPDVRMPAIAPAAMTPTPVTPRLSHSHRRPWLSFIEAFRRIPPSATAQSCHVAADALRPAATRIPAPGTAPRARPQRR